MSSAAVDTNTSQETASSRSQKNGWVLIIIGGIIGIILILAISAFLSNRPYHYQGSLIENPQTAPDFQLGDQHGDLFSLSAQKGKVVLIFFGYTHCPDVCPVTLYQFKQIREQLGEQSQNVRFVFVTVDPERDTQERLLTHLANFDPAIVGLTADRTKLESVWWDYGVAQEIREVSGASDYLVDHTARVYVVDKNGNLRLTYPFGVDSQAILDDVEHLLSE